MIVMLCRNRVSDYSHWRAVFASHRAAHQEAGLRLVNIEEPNNVFVVFEVASLEKAREFIGNPETAKAAEGSGVVDGEYHFVEDAGATDRLATSGVAQSLERHETPRGNQG